MGRVGDGWGQVMFQFPPADFTYTDREAVHLAILVKHARTCAHIHTNFIAWLLAWV